MSTHYHVASVTSPSVKGMTTMPDDFDFSTHYSVAGREGIAFYAIDFATTSTEESWTFIGSDDDDPEDEANYVYDEPEEVPDLTRVRLVMVGDDHVWTVDVDDCEPIADDAYCPECGQIGCRAYA